MPQGKIIVASGALLIGIICILPNILGYIELGRKYEPFTKFFTSPIVFDEVAVYGSSAAYVAETNKLPGETEIFELRDLPSIKYHLPIFFEGLTGKISRNTRIGWIVFKFLFPATSFILAFYVARKLSGNTWIGILAATIFFSVGFGARTLIDINSAQPILFSRIHSPAATLPFFLIFIISLTRAIEGNRKEILIAGIAGGLLFYTYYYYQLAIAPALIILCLWYSQEKKWAQVKSIILIGIIANIVALPWYINYLETTLRSPHFLSRWQANTYFPPIEHILLLVAVIVLLIVGRHIREKKISSEPLEVYRPLLALIISSAFLEFIVATNTTVILEPGHFTQQIIISLSSIAAVSYFGRYLLLMPRYKKIIAGTALIIVAVALVKQYSVWENTKAFFVASENERIAERLVKKHTTTDDVIALNDPYLSSVFPARIWRYRFYGSYGFSGLASTPADENLKRYIIIRKLFGAPWKEIEQELRAEKETIQSPLKTATIPFLLTFETKTPEPNTIKALGAFYAAPPEDFFAKRKLTHLVSTTIEEGRMAQDNAAELGMKLIKVAEENGVGIYKITSKQVKI